MSDGAANSNTENSCNTDSHCRTSSGRRRRRRRRRRRVLKEMLLFQHERGEKEATEGLHERIKETSCDGR